MLPQYGKQVWQQSGWSLGRGREYTPGYHIVLDIGPVVTVHWDEVALWIIWKPACHPLYMKYIMPLLAILCCKVRHH